MYIEVYITVNIDIIDYVIYQCTQLFMRSDGGSYSEWGWSERSLFCLLAALGYRYLNQSIFKITFLWKDSKFRRGPQAMIMSDRFLANI